MPVKVWLALLSTIAALLAAAPLAHAAGAFSLGVTPGEVTASSAVLWGKANKSGAYVLDIARNRRFTRGLDAHLVRARKTHDNTLQLRVKRLRPDTRYWFRFARGRAHSDVGTFVTAPKPRASATVEFAWTGDLDFNTAPGKRKPFWNDGGIYRRMKAEGNDFNINLGDTIYTDSEIPGRLNPLALTVAQKWAKYRINLGNRSLRALRGSAGFYSQWDDHEFINDFSPNQNTFHPSGSGPGVNINGHTLYQRGQQAFRDYAPVRWSKRDGLYRTIRWGRNLELFFIDERSFRSPNADNGGACDNAQTGNPDLAPTAPPRTRAVFAAVYAPFGQPVSQQCLDAIRNPDRTFLGQRQLTRFLRDVKASNARFKVIVNEMAIMQYYLNPYDRWEGFEAERQQVLRELQSVKNVIFLSTDAHTTFINDARFQTLEDGGPINSGITDVVIGPAATANFGLEIDTTTGQPGTGAVADSAFFTPPPPDGVGMQCSIVDQFSYGQVKVTADRLTITPKGIDGKPQRDGDRPCGPLVLNYSR